MTHQPILNLGTNSDQPTLNLGQSLPISPEFGRIRAQVGQAPVKFGQRFRIVGSIDQIGPDRRILGGCWPDLCRTWQTLHQAWPKSANFGRTRTILNRCWSNLGRDRQNRGQSWPNRTKSIKLGQDWPEIGQSVELSWPEFDKHTSRSTSTRQKDNFLGAPIERRGVRGCGRV